MVTVARDRMELLFRRAEEASAGGAPERADRYVEMARRIGTRYNVRMSPAMRARFCRGCLSYFREGVNVRTRLRAGRRVRTCLKCQRSARVPIRLSAPAWEPASSRPPGGLVEPIAVPLDELAEEDEDVGEPIDEA